MFLQLLAGNESSRANLAPKLIRVGLVALCLWWGYALWAHIALKATQPTDSMAQLKQVAETAQWIGIALLAWGLLRGSLTQTAPKALPLVLTVILCGQAVHALLPFLVLLFPVNTAHPAAVWPLLLLGALVFASRVAALVAYRRLPMLAMALVLLNAFAPLLAGHGAAVSADPGDPAATIAKDDTPVLRTQPGLDTGSRVVPVNSIMLLSGPSLALDLFSIALLYAFYRSRRPTPSHEAPAP